MVIELVEIWELLIFNLEGCDVTVQPKFWILSLLILLGGINPSSAASPTVDPKVLHIINRLSFGPRPGDIQRVKSIGVDGYIKEQLSPDAIPEPKASLAKFHG